MQNLKNLEKAIKGPYKMRGWTLVKFEIVPHILMSGWTAYWTKGTRTASFSGVIADAPPAIRAAYNDFVRNAS